MCASFATPLVDPTLCRQPLVFYFSNSCWERFPRNQPAQLSDQELQRCFSPLSSSTFPRCMPISFLYISNYIVQHRQSHEEDPSDGDRA